jgi:hypothetical protein
MASTRHERRRSNAWRRFCASMSERAASRGALSWHGGGDCSYAERRAVDAYR